MRYFKWHLNFWRLNTWQKYLHLFFLLEVVALKPGIKKAKILCKGFQAKGVDMCSFQFIIIIIII